MSEGGLKILFNLANKEEKMDYGQIEDYLYFSDTDETEEKPYSETKTLDEVLNGLIEKVVSTCKEQNLVVKNREQLYEELVKDIIASLKQEVEQIELQVQVAKEPTVDDKAAGDKNDSAE